MKKIFLLVMLVFAGKGYAQILTINDTNPSLVASSIVMYADAPFYTAGVTCSLVGTPFGLVGGYFTTNDCCTFSGYPGWATWGLGTSPRPCPALLVSSFQWTDAVITLELGPTSPCTGGIGIAVSFNTIGSCWGALTTYSGTACGIPFIITWINVGPDVTINIT